MLGADVDPERDVGPWLGEELALALPAAGTDPLLLAAVADRPAAERFRDRLPAGTASAFAGDYLADRAATPRSRRRPSGRTKGRPSLADASVYRRAAELEPAPVELYAPAAGVRRLLATAPAAVRAVGAFADAPHFEGLAARVRPESEGVRVSARVLRAPGAPPAQEFAPALQGRAPASAAAFLLAPGADALVGLLERGGAAALVNAVRAALPELAGHRSRPRRARPARPARRPSR